MKLWPIYTACAAWFLWILGFSGILFDDAIIGCECAVIGLQGWIPILSWIKRGFRELPVFEIYAASHLPYYVHPVAQRAETLRIYDQETLQFSLACVVVFLLFLQIAFYFTRRILDGDSEFRINRKLGNVFHGFVAGDLKPYWLMIWCWVLFEVAKRLNLLPELGVFFQPISRGITAISMLSVFVLAFAFGKRVLQPHQVFWLFAAIGIQGIIDLSSGFISGFARTCIVFLIAFVISRKTIPIFTVAVLFAVLSFLHLGKGDVRERFWSQGFSDVSGSPIEVMDYWISRSWEKLSTGEVTVAETGRRLMDRGTLLHMVSLAITECPKNRDHLIGETYLHLPALVIPRFFWPNKPRGTWSSETLAIHLGIQDVEATNYTSIGVGQIAEGWVNFAWLGIMFEALALGSLLAIPAVLSFDQSVRSPGMLLAASTLPLATNLEHCLSQWIVILITGWLLTFLVMYFIAKRTSSVSYSD